MRHVLPVLVIAATVTLVASACAAPENEQPMCHSQPPTVLMAESVPSASLIPCVRAVPDGWSFQSFVANDTVASFSLGRQDGGLLGVELRASCEPEGGSVPADEPGVHQYRSIQNGGATIVWTSIFTGGCSRAQATFPSAPQASDVAAVRAALSFIARDELQPA
jgi:hypothetical protein